MRFNSILLHFLSDLEEKSHFNDLHHFILFMFSKFSQFTQSLQDELATGKPQKQIADPQIAKGILKTETPQ